MSTVTEPSPNGPVTQLPGNDPLEDTLKTVADGLRTRQELIRQQEETIRQLRTELEQTTFERDIYLRSLHHLSWNEMKDKIKPFTEEEMREMEESGLTLGQFVEELKAEWGEPK